MQKIFQPFKGWAIRGICWRHIVVSDLSACRAKLSIKRPPDAGSMLAQRLRRWANIKPTSGQRVLSAPVLICWNDKACRLDAQSSPTRDSCWAG